jgi:glycosyltransferase involved in cell wall biosynthesis
MKMKSNKMLTVVTVHMNSIDALTLTLDSVKNQKQRSKIEYVVVDGASSDGSLVLLEQRRLEIDILHSSSDRGVYDAMNRGVQLSSGSWLYFLNAGDVFFDDDSVGRILHQIDDSDVLFSDVLVNDGNKVFNFKTSFESRTLNHQGFVYRRELHDKFGPYSVIKGFTSADYLFFLQLNGLKVRKLDTSIAIFKTGGLSSTVNAVRQKYCLDFLSGKIGALNLAARLVIYPVYRILTKIIR